MYITGTNQLFMSFDESLKENNKCHRIPCVHFLFAFNSRTKSNDLIIPPQEETFKHMNITDETMAF